MKHYLTDIAEVFSHVSSSEKGLSQKEAALRLEKNGKNKLKEEKKIPIWRRFLSQLGDPMIIILLVAAAISGVVEIGESLYRGHNISIPTDSIIILAVVIINSILGVYQESKAEAAIEALQKMSAATSKVLRDGQIISVKSEDLVIGDIVILEAGDAVPADCRIFESASLKIEEAALTGESVPVNKFIDTLTPHKDGDIPLGDRKNTAYMGSIVVYVLGKAVVVSTGMDTEMCKIADAIAMASASDRSPLHEKLSQLSKVL